MAVIHIVLGKANPDRMNGVNRVVHELCTRQHQAAMSIELWGITAHPVHDYPERVYRTRLFHPCNNPFRVTPALAGAIREMDPHTVFHLHGGFIPAMYAISRYLSRKGFRFVFTPHGSYNLVAMERNKRLKGLYMRLFERALLERSAAVHCLGSSEAEGVRSLLPGIHTVLIPYGWDLPEEASVPAEGTPFVVAYCGRLDVYTKGLLELVEGFDRFHERRPDARLWIIGDGAERQKLEQFAQTLPCYPALQFWGARYGDDKVKLLRQCKVFAAPSRNEGLPASVLEAAAMGIPCLVTKATNVGEAIQAFHAGTVIDRTSAGDIGRALDDLYYTMADQRRGTAMGRNARAMVAAEFNWGHVLAKFQNLYA
jgi:glycosyltransferase involved in cell wall biosynthesis